MNQTADQSKTIEFNSSFISSSNEKNYPKLGTNEKKRIFEVFHKSEIICKNALDNQTQKKDTFKQHKCIYCGKIYKNINRFEVHMKIHVSYI